MMKINSASSSKRNSVFEILRVIAILFIIGHHFAYHGSFDFSELGNSALITLNKFWINFFIQAGKMGVNLFVLISGYFLINSKFKTEKVLSLLIEMLIFSITIGVIFWIIDGKTFDEKLFKFIFFPFGSETWWFMTSYLLLYIFSPFLNIALKAMNKKAHLILIGVLLLVWSIMPTFENLTYGFSTFGWFLTVYIVSAYIGLYDLKIKIKPWIGISIAFFVFVGCFAIRFSFQNYLDNSNYFVKRVINWFYYINLNNVVSFSSALLLFLSFKNIKPVCIKPLNVISSTMLAVYLFHDHRDVRKFLWIDLFKNASYASSHYLIVYSIGAILAVFAMGVAVGFIYKYAIGTWVSKFLNYFDKKALHKIDNIINEPFNTHSLAD